MITTSVIPAAAASATSQELLVDIVERAIRPYCLNSKAMPTASVEFTNGTVSVLGGNAIVPISAKVTIVTPSCTGCGKADIQVFTENFEVGFDATTANTITLTPGSATSTTPADIKCCKARSVKLTTALTVTIA